MAHGPHGHVHQNLEPAHSTRESSKGPHSGHCQQPGRVRMPILDKSNG